MKFIKQLTTLAIFTLNANSPAAAAQSVDATSQRNKCSADCRQLLQQDKYSGTKCAQAVTVHPIPQVFQACMDGERNAFKQACAARCANFNSAETVPFEKLSSFHACTKHKKGLREKFIWCRKGYDENRERLSSIVSSDIVKDVSEEELTDDEPVQRQNHDGSRTLVREGDQALEKQLEFQRVTDTLHVTSQHREMIGAGSTILEQESDSEQFDSQQTQLAVAVLPSQEMKHLQHGTVSSGIIADCIMRSVSGLSLSDVLECESSNSAESSSAVSNSNAFNYPPFALMRPDSFLATFIGVKSNALFSAEETVEYIDFSNSGWGCNCNHAHGMRKWGSSLDTLLFLLLEEVFKDNVGARNNVSLPSSHLRKSPNREGFGFGLDLTSKSPADNRTLESSSTTTRPDPNENKIDPLQLSFRKELYHVWIAQVRFEEGGDNENESIQHPLSSSGEVIAFMLMIDPGDLLGNSISSEAGPPASNITGIASLASATGSSKSQSTDDPFTTSQLFLRRWMHPYWADVKREELDPLHTTAARPGTSEAFLVGNGEAKRSESALSIGYSFQSQTDHPQRTGTKYLKDLLHLTETSSSLLMTPAQAAEAEVGADDIVAAYGAITLLQLSFDVLSHIWLIPMHSRLKPGDSLWLVYLNISEKYVNVISCRTRSDNPHLDGDALQARRSFYIEAITLALLFLLLFCHYYSSSSAMRPLELDLTIEHKKAQLMSKETSLNKEGCVNDDGRDWEQEVSSTDWKDTLEEIVAKRKFQWQQGLLCIAPLLDCMSLCWKDKRRKIQLAVAVAVACESVEVRWKWKCVFSFQRLSWMSSWVSEIERLVAS